MESLTLGLSIKNNLSDQSSNGKIERKFCKSKQIIGNSFYATGKRKNAIARVWLKRGTGKVTINNRTMDSYFARDAYKSLVLKPLVETNCINQYDVFCTAKGGGTTGQAGAIAHGIAKALDCVSEDYHSVLRSGGFLTRDSRVVERKKYGKRKARKSTQFSKR